jgi:CARDB
MADHDALSSLITDHAAIPASSTAAQTRDKIIAAAKKAKPLLDGGTPVPPQPPQEGIDLQVTSLALDPPSPAVGQSTKVTVKVKNAGTVKTPDGIGVGVGLFAGALQVSYVAAGAPIGPGEEVTLDTTTSPYTGGNWTPATAGTVAFKAFADDTNVIVEYAEGNNTKETQVTVTAGTTPTPSPTGKPYTASSSWNTKVPTNANFRQEPGLNQGGAYTNRDAYSGPVVESKASDPLVTMNVGPSWGWPGQQLQFHCPTGQTGASGTDGSLVVIDGDQVYDFWQFTRSGPNSASCSAWAKSNRKTGSGWGQANPFQAAGIHAAGSALLAGLIRGSELTDPAIGHALAIGIRRNLANSAHVGEAIYSDGGNGPIPEGTRCAIPRSTSKPAGLNKQISNLWDALVDYGAFVIDVADGVQSIYFWCDPNSVPAVDAAAANGNNSSALSMALRIIT